LTAEIATWGFLRMADARMGNLKQIGRRIVLYCLLGRYLSKNEE
jgi:hypothetical protein